jgi:hypothetical protein
MPGREPAPPTESPDHPRPGAFTTSPPDPNVAAELSALAKRLCAGYFLNLLMVIFML